MIGHWSKGTCRLYYILSKKNIFYDIMYHRIYNIILNLRKNLRTRAYLYHIIIISVGDYLVGQRAYYMRFTVGSKSRPIAGARVGVNGGEHTSGFSVAFGLISSK